MFSKGKLTTLLVNIALILLIVLIITKIGFIFAPLVNIAGILLLPIIIALFLFYAVKPVIKRLEFLKISKSLKIILTLVLFFVLISVIIAYGGAIIKQQFEGSFSGNLDSILDKNTLLGGKISGIVSDFELTQRTVDFLNNIFKSITSNFGTFFSYLGNVGTQIILVPFILFYMLKDGDGFSKRVLKAVPQGYRNFTKEVMHQIDEILSTYISGQLMVAFVIGILMFIGYLIIGMPNALLMAFFSMITSIIPFIGAFLGIIPALLISLTINIPMLVKVIIVAVIVQQVEGNLVTPNIIGNKLNVHPLTVILVIIISITLFGLLGAFMGLPLYVVLKIVLNAGYKLYTMKKLQIKEQ